MAFKTWFRKNLLAGLLAAVPILGTIVLFSWLLEQATGPGYNWLKGVVTREESKFLATKAGVFLFRSMVLVLMVWVVVLFGALTRNFLGRRIIRVGEALLEGLPVVNRVYRALKQMSEAFWDQNKTTFGQVVAVEYPRRGIYTIGFITYQGRKAQSGKPGEKLVNVFLPTSPNPTSGYVIILPEKDVTPLDMTPEDVIKLVISGGAIAADSLKAAGVLVARNRGGEKAPQVENSAARPG
jgi:uncharacterized membrane protein